MRVLKKKEGQCITGIPQPTPHNRQAC